nr:MAG TPA: hypothetical protein [Caudoviricetes sp.]
MEVQDHDLRLIGCFNFSKNTKHTESNSPRTLCDL